ncbi:MAG: histidine triad nucleotide-binding protein [Myxococcales bacterium]|nr:histidine triad nucleotide-binding protein [Myxococcales bacterium]
MSDDNCIFCKIVKKEIPATIIYEDDHVLAFEDLNPQAPVHCLVITKKHIVGGNDMTPEDTIALGHMLLAGKKVAEIKNIADDGYRFVINTGAHGGQRVFHIHLHVMGGRPLSWPPG